MSDVLAKNTLYLTLASIGQKLIAFVYFLFLARIMMPESTGVYFLAVSIATIFSVITDFGINPVTIREVAKHPDETVPFMQKALGTKLPFMLIGIFAAIVSGKLLGYNPLVQQLITLAAIVILLDAVSLLYYGLLRGHHQLQFESLGIFLGQSLTAIFGALVLIFHPSLHLLIFALMIGSAFNAVFSVSVASRFFGKKILIPKWDFMQMKNLLVMAFPFALAAIFVKVFSYIDTIFISKMIGNVAVGIYSIAYKFTYAFQFLPLAFVAALYPGMSALVGRDAKALSKMFNQANRYMIILAVPIVFGLFVIAPEVVLLAGEGYSQSSTILQVLIFALIPIFLDFPIGSLLNAANRQTTKTVIVGITMLINIILNIILIPVFGVIGAAYAALVSFSFMYFAGLSFVPKIIPGFRYAKMIRMIFPVIFSGIVMLFVSILVKPSIGYLGTIPIAAFVYGLTLYLSKAVRKGDLVTAKKLLKRS